MENKNLEELFEDFMNDTALESVSCEELCAMINAFRSLCSENKINSRNAFDLDMTECLHKWLIKKKDENKLSSDLLADVTDYLEATGKIYGCRIDSVNNSITNLVGRVKIGGIIANNIDDLDLEDDQTDNNDEQPEIKPEKKKMKVMLTTSDKLRGDPIESYARDESSFDIMELIRAGNPSDYFKSKYENITFLEEHKMVMERSKNVVKSNEVFKMDLKKLSKAFKTGNSVCPGFPGFVAERDRKACGQDPWVGSTENSTSINNSASPPSTNHESIFDLDNEYDIDSNLTKEERVEQLRGLIDCIEGADSDYSFYNPALLTNWAGPKAWKVQMIKKSLKTKNKKNKSPEDFSEKDLDDDDEDNDDDDDDNDNNDDDDGDDDDNDSKLDQVKPSKYLRKTSKYIVNFSNISKINATLSQLVMGRQHISSNSLRKWHALNNVCDPHPFKSTYMSKYLQNLELYPKWLISQTKKVGGDDDISDSDDQNDCGNDAESVKTDHVIVGNTDVDDINVDHLSIDNLNDDNLNVNDDGVDVNNALSVKSDNEKAEGNENEDDKNSNNKNDDDDDDELKETKLCVSVLKTEIINIMKRESVDIQFQSGNNKSMYGMPFKNLMNILTEWDSDCTLSLVYVCLLHLVNEQRIKVVNSDGIIDNSFNMGSSYVIKLK